MEALEALEEEALAHKMVGQEEEDEVGGKALASEGTGS